MNIKAVDHIILTVKDIEKSVKFYENVLGMKKNIFANGRVSLKFGSQKINLHQAGQEFEPKAAFPMPGSIDICLITDMKIEQVSNHFKKLDIQIIEGPIKRTGANGPIISLYIRDPDNNLIEVSNYL